MTRDARLSALHRGGFRLRGRACLTGICAGSVTASSSHPGRSAWRAGSRASRGERLRAAAAGRHASLRIQDRLENTPSMSEAGNTSSTASNCSQVKNSFCRRKGIGVCSRCGGEAAGRGNRHRHYSLELIRPGCSRKDAVRANAGRPFGCRQEGMARHGDTGGSRARGLAVMNSHRMRAVGTRGGRVEGQRRCLQTGGDVIRASLGSVLAFAVLFAVGAVVTPARAQTTNWTGATGDWFTSGNWDNGVPTGATATTNVQNGGTAQINGAAANAGTALAINGGSTVDLQAGGSLTTGGTSIGSTGTLLLSGSTAVTGTITMGVGGVVRATTTGTLATDINNLATVAATSGNTLTLTGNNIVVGGGPGTTARFGSSTDTGTVVLSAGNVLFLSGSAGAVDGGTLVLGNSTSASLLNVLSSFTVGSSATPATLDLNGIATNVVNLTGNSAGTVTNGAASATTLTLRQSSSTFGGSIQDGTGGLNLSVLAAPSLTVTLTGSNTYSGTTNVTSGLQIGNGGTTGTLGTGNVTLNGTGTLTFNR